MRYSGPEGIYLDDCDIDQEFLNEDDIEFSAEKVRRSSVIVQDFPYLKRFKREGAYYFDENFTAVGDEDYEDLSEFDKELLETYGDVEIGAEYDYSQFENYNKEPTAAPEVIPEVKVLPEMESVQEEEIATESERYVTTPAPAVERKRQSGPGQIKIRSRIRVAKCQEQNIAIRFHNIVQFTISLVLLPKHVTHIQLCVSYFWQS